MNKFPVPMPPPGEMLRRRQAEMYRRRKRMICLCVLCLTAVFLALVFSRAILICQNQGLGMFPTAEEGDLVLAWRNRAVWSREDLIVFRMDGELHLGRIAAVERDWVMMDDSGSLLVNGSVCNSQALYPTYARRDGEYPQQVPEGTVYVLGDHRTQSRDSRDFGAVPMEWIKGKVFAIVRIGDL